MNIVLNERQLPGQSPPKKRIKRSLSVYEKESIINIYKTCRESQPNGTETERVNFVSRASGASISSVYKVLAEYKTGNGLSAPKNYHRARGVLDKVSQETKASIRRKIHEFFVRNEPPTLDKILSAINNDNELQDFKRSTLAKLIKEINRYQSASFEYPVGINETPADTKQKMENKNLLNEVDVERHEGVEEIYIKEEREDSDAYSYQNALFEYPVETETNKILVDIKGIKEEYEELLNEDSVKLREGVENAYIKEERENSEENRSEFTFSGQITTKIKIENDYSTLNVSEANNEDAHDDMTFKYDEIQNFKEEYSDLNESSSTHTDEWKSDNGYLRSPSGEYNPTKGYSEIGREGPQTQYYVLEPNAYNCNNCDSEAAKKSTLKEHPRCYKSLNGFKTFNCTSCSFQTKYKASINAHVGRHQNNIPVKSTWHCGSCGYETYYKCNLKNHLQKHQIKEFQCDQCHFQTDKEKTLKNHYLRHKPIDEVETFKCDQCPFYTRYQHSLKTHLRNHKKKASVHECSKCGYKTDKPFDIRLHLLVH